jgi:tripartite-type tricarboxylate transporter receptor subunit TctC
MFLDHYRLSGFLIGCILPCFASAPLFGQEFYKGKTLTFVVGTAPGGGFDTYTRIMARHIGKHIPGNPGTLVQNMPGAGNLIAANYIYNKAEPDGLTIGHFSGSMIFKHVLGDQGVMFDGRNFAWLGTPAPERHTCVLTEKSGVKTLDEWAAAKRPMKIGSLGPGNATSALPQLLRAILGLPASIVEGFKGTSDIRLAAESGEIDGACWGWDSIKVTWAKALESNFVRPIIQTTLEPHPDLPNIPVAIDRAKTKEGQDLFRFAYQAYGPSAIAYSLPPKVPKDRLLTLQRAFVATMKDPEYLAETKKANLVVSPIDGPGITKVVADLYTVDPKLLARFREITEVTSPSKQ